MPRRTERALLLTALAIGLAGALLVAAARDPEAHGPDTVVRVTLIWLRLAVAVIVCHVVLVRRQRGGDQLLLPVSVALTGVGIAVILGLDAELASRQLNWLWVSLAVFLVALVGMPPLETLRDYRYTFGLLTAGLLLLTMVAGREINGAKLWLVMGPLRLQPGELAKLTLVLFIAGYLDRRGDSLVSASRLWAGVWWPSVRHLGPLLAMWSLAVVLLIGLRDLGTALLFFGTFLAMLYAATGHGFYLAAGAASMAAAVSVCARLFGHVARRLEGWLDPWSRIDQAGYQISQGLFAIAAGGMTGVGLGLGRGERVPAAPTDFPFAIVCEELGWLGAALVVALYLVWVYRAMRVAVIQQNRFRALLAVGLGALIANQALVILMGVTKLIPLTGITLPFISYGGSSLLSNFLMLAILLRASEKH